MQAYAPNASLPPQLLHAASLLSEGRLDAAETLVRGYLRQHGHHTEGMRLLARIAIGRDALDDAELLLEEVVARVPAHHDARSELAAVLGQRRRYLPALMHIEYLLRIDPHNPGWRLLYAKACDGLTRYDEALRAYEQLLQENPGEPGLELAIAHVHRKRGDSSEAVAGFRRATGHAGAAEGAAFLALADLKTYRFTDEEIARMRQAEAGAGAGAGRPALCFALGKALEDRRVFEESFRYYERGNALHRRELPYQPDLVDRLFRLQASTCTAELLAGHGQWGCPRSDPIFIVGLPRSGSTLIEQILASHSRVDATLELPEIPRLVQQFRSRRPDEPPRYPGILAELDAGELRRMGEIYLEETQVYRRGAPFFIDKNPANFRDIGFIHLILPNARIIDARRGAMACCFANFKQLFGSGHDFTYELGEMGRYCRAYVELMEHWDRVLPGKVLRVRYEDVVADLEGSVRRILEFCGLPFESACLEFHRSGRSVQTSSSQQVRQPIYRQALEQWRNYEPWLGRLKAALGALANS